MPTGRGGRVVDGTGLENRRAVKRTEGSNPSLSAKNIVLKRPVYLKKYIR